MIKIIIYIKIINWIFGPLLIYQKHAEGDKEKLLELTNKRKEKNKQLEIAIDNLQDVCFEKTVDNLKKKIEEKLEVEYDINAYYNEKSYKMGFEDAVKLIVGSRKSENL